MGVGMQIVCLGFTGAACIEAEAGAQLVRLERFSGCLKDCNLAVEAMRGTVPLIYDARLDLIMRPGELVPIEHSMNEDPEAAVRAVFDAAEREMERQVARTRH
jgi:hypothetical protein